MIKSFGDKITENIFFTGKSAKLPHDILSRARVKLFTINSAIKLATLREDPANHFKELQGKHRGVYSIRVNDQYRVTFTWDGIDAYQVKVEDYHDRL